MAQQYNQSPRSGSLTYGSSPDPAFLSDLRSPFASSPYQPRYGRAGSTPHPSWKNHNQSHSNHNKSHQRYYQHNESQNKFNFTPRGGGRGRGHFRGGGRGGHQRGDPQPGDVRLYVNPSMLSDPWKELTDMLNQRGPNSPTTPNNSRNTTFESNEGSSAPQSPNLSQDDQTVAGDSIADQPVSSPCKT